MKKIFTLMVLVVTLTSCSSDDDETFQYEQGGELGPNQRRLQFYWGSQEAMKPYWTVNGVEKAVPEQNGEFNGVTITRIVEVGDLVSMRLLQSGEQDPSIDVKIIDVSAGVGVSPVLTFDDCNCNELIIDAITIE